MPRRSCPIHRSSTGAVLTAGSQRNGGSDADAGRIVVSMQRGALREGDGQMLFFMIALMVIGVAIAVVPLVVTIAKTRETAGGAALPTVATTETTNTTAVRRAA